MPVYTDIRKDLRYRQGMEEEKIERAEKMIKEGLAVSFVHKVTGPSMEKVEVIVRKLESQ